MRKRRSAAREETMHPAMIDLVVANRILANEGILDAFGHVSIRHPKNPSRYLMSRSLAPSLVLPKDILEYDLDSRPIGFTARSPAPTLFLERFIHGEIYKSRPDVHAVVHSHSPTTIPFGVTGIPLKPICHMSGFLAGGTRIFDIRDVDAKSDMLIRTPRLGAAHAKLLGKTTVTLMRGHGNVVVAPDARLAVYRAIYCEVNARLQLQAASLGTSPRFLSAVEAKNAATSTASVLDRPWRYWVERAGCTGWYAEE